MAKTLRDTVSGAGKVATGTTRGVARTGSSVGAAARGKTADANPTELLRQSVQHLAGTLAERAVSGLSGRVTGAAGRLNEYAEGDGGNLVAALTGVDKLAEGATPMRAAMSAGMSKLGQSVKDTVVSAKDSLTGAGGTGAKAKKLNLTNIVEQLDVGAPVELVYDQWTQFADFPKFMKKLEQVEQVSDEKLSWTGRVFWSRRTWESTILEQVPFERIVWRSKGAKGYIDGAVTFHEIAPNLTRILVVLEYHPNGFFEKTGNMWRAAGRRCRLELKAFERHLMTEAVLHPDDIVGWHGEIRDGEIVEDDETARRAEQEYAEDEAEGVAEDDEPLDDEAEELDQGEREDEGQDEGVDEEGEEGEADQPAGVGGAREDEPRRYPRRSVAARRAATSRGSRERRGART